MGKFIPPPYKVKRNGEWVWVYPEPQDYKPDGKLKSIQVTQDGIYKQYKKRKK